MQYKFPYFEDRPHIPIYLGAGEYKTRYLPLLDTGADFTTLCKHDAGVLGLDWDKGEEISLDNADGTEFKARMFTLPLEIEDLTFRSRICFIDTNTFSMPLLGRRDFFHHFIIAIDETSKMVELKRR